MMPNLIAFGRKGANVKIKHVVSAVLLLLPLSLGAQVQPKPLPQAVRVIRSTVRPGQPGLVTFRVVGTSVPEQGMWANLTLTSRGSEQAPAGVSTQYDCQATQNLFVCPIISMYGRPSGTFQIISIMIGANSSSGQSRRTFKAGEDFQAVGEITIENPKAPQPPNLDGLKISDVDVDSGATN
jgi:hypothetical protein